MDYDTLITEALAAPIGGWDFSAFAGRYVTGSPPWSYEEVVRERLPRVRSLLDIGTGGGEFLSSLAPLPARTAATEGHPPNVAIARERLTPLGVEVAAVDGNALPFPDGSFELVVSRHHAYDPDEVLRVLVPHGTLLTQQVGGCDLAELNEALAAPPHPHRHWDLERAIAGLEKAGFAVTWQAESFIPARFRDIGAVVQFLRVVPWQVPDFDVRTYESALRALHERMQAGHALSARSHRFALIACPR
ncbi:class I SAM-dependent methyltransferase [Nonomuraea sp. C10]|uniref:class I SAM-dependent methyltransferase n=1 Tax=Nonomuraea sp. C10 TaxID=2600577 RepID=UPI0011CDDA41|nr:class I SAM-dependent methyltransferase [Nonomuraea sp. C10]TXK34132.1 class I SAM-dependent methyltransferase [Nonomuraea sp. C10]